MINFKVIYLKENQGHGNARRISLDNSTYDLVALMDSDDISYPTRFEKQLKLFEDNPTLSICGGQITEFIGDPNNITGQRYVPLNDKEIKEYLKKRCPMNQVTVMFNKKDYYLAGGYIDWYCDEDYYLWARMVLNNCIFANVNDNLVNVRIGDEMSARRGGMKYFKSEAKLQKYMYKQKIISFPRYLYNVLIRFGGEVLIPNKLRTFLFKKLRKEVKVSLNDSEEDIVSKGQQDFSVAMCVYGKDNPHFFESALESIINQTVIPKEIVLVVDGPIPESIQKIIDKILKKCQEIIS